MTCLAVRLEPLLAQARDPITNVERALRCLARSGKSNEGGVITIVYGRPEAKTSTPWETRPEPVFRHHQISARIPSILLRGLDNVKGECTLVTMAWNAGSVGVP